MSSELKEHYDKIYKYCYFKVKNAQLAEDLTQEAFIKFFTQDTYISRGKPLAYLFIIAKNLCMDTYRKIEALPLDSNIAVESGIEALETSLSVRQAISTLPQDFQEILLLRYANDLSLAEISTITGLSRFAVYRKINNALGRLRLILREEDF